MRLPSTSRFLTRIQVSISEETPTSVLSACSPPSVRLVNRAVISRDFIASIRRVSVDADRRVGADARQVGDRVDDGHRRLELLDLAVHAHEVHLEARVLRPLGVDAQQALLDPVLRSMPIERMFRTIWSGDSSKAK